MRLETDFRLIAYPMDLDGFLTPILLALSNGRRFRRRENRTLFISERAENSGPSLSFPCRMQVS